MKTKEEILKGDLTAEEIEYEIFWDGFEAGDKNEGGDYTEVERIELIKEYARQKCKEQREICAKKAKAYIDNSMGDYNEVPRVFTNTILESPLPKFD